MKIGKNKLLDRIPTDSWQRPRPTVGSRFVGVIRKAAKVVGYNFTQLDVAESNMKGLGFW